MWDPIRAKNGERERERERERKRSGSKVDGGVGLRLIGGLGRLVGR